ncbi:TrbI/VirB10 family protein (plasmid) [Azospirillum sp. HJ39]|uniref:TrbI/VirB10 family protein n=1 Tax=Azospirillum sp. HJ39 TaxID=3159496 RepID=UPI003556AD0D
MFQSAACAVVGLTLAGCWEKNEDKPAPTVPEKRSGMSDLYSVAPLAAPPAAIAVAKVSARSATVGQLVAIGPLFDLTPFDEVSEVQVQVEGDGGLIVRGAPVAPGVPVAVSPTDGGALQYEPPAQGGRGSVALRVRSKAGGLSEWARVMLVTQPPAPPPRVEKIEVPPPPVPPTSAELRRLKIDRLLAALGEEGIAERLRGGPVPVEEDQEPPAEPSGPPRDRDYGRLRLKDDQTTLPVDRSRRITADRYIGAILESRTVSQLEGRAILVADAHIFGGDGRKILIEKGTKFICRFKKLEREGDTRLPMRCGRFIRPDGVSGLLSEADVADQSGATGLVGDVDNRNWERYGAAFVTASIGALAAIGANNSVQNQLVAQGVQNMTDNMSKATERVLEKNLDLSPIMTVPVGSRVQIIPMNDIVFIEG